MIALSMIGRLMVAGLEDSDEELVLGIRMRADQAVSESEARAIYVYMTGEGQYRRRVVPVLRQRGLVIPSPAEIQALYDGSNADIIQGGRGPFGFSTTNPIPTVCVRCSNRYLHLLRWRGNAVDATRLGSQQSTVCNGSIDQYTLSQRGQVVSTIFISPYHRKTSALAPDGFSLAEKP
jgi:hypothetical protein